MKLFVLDQDKTEGQSPFSSIFETLLNLSVCLTYLFPRSAFTRFTRSQDARTSRACKEKKEGREEERKAASKRYPNSRLSSELGKVPNHIPQLFLKRRALALGSWMGDRGGQRGGVSCRKECYFNLNEMVVFTSSSVEQSLDR